MCQEEAAWLVAERKVSYIFAVYNECTRGGWFELLLHDYLINIAIQISQIIEDPLGWFSSSLIPIERPLLYFMSFLWANVQLGQML